MEIPDKLKICGFDYTVEVRKLDDGSLFGMHILSECKILIADDIKTVQKTEHTFMHEIFHAVDIAIGTDLNEKQIGALSRALYQVLKDNNLLKE